MRADSLHRAASNIAELLIASDLLSVIRQCRGAHGVQLQEALKQLSGTGNQLLEGAASFAKDEQTVLRCLHLSNTFGEAYWDTLCAEATEEPRRQAELVRLYSRVMFASSHLPLLVSLIDQVEAEPLIDQEQSTEAAVAEGEEWLTLRLSDAGEKASDPDRVARAIDGIDMLYSACASLTRRTTMDLQLYGVFGSEHRDISFIGDQDSIHAVKAIIESIPDAVGAIDPEHDIDIQKLVQSLPIFDDLITLGKLGTFSATDLQDITDTMHQGVLLSLESGVVLLFDAESEETLDQGGDDTRTNSSDEYYDQYLHEREKMQQDDDIRERPSEGIPISDAEKATVDKHDATISSLLKGRGRK